jgi:hypothetical protein
MNKKTTATSGKLTKGVYAKVKMWRHVMRYFNFNFNKVTEKVNTNIYVECCVRFVNTDCKYCTWFESLCDFYPDIRNKC